MKFALNIIGLFFACASGLAQGQQAWKGLAIEGNILTGGLLKHSEKIQTSMPALSMAAEVNFAKHLYGQKAWHQGRGYPWIGLGVMVLDYGKPDVFGHAVGIYPNIQIDLVKRQAWEWTFRAGFGLCYVTRPFERFPDPNPENTAIGGHWNNISPFSTHLRYQIHERWDIQAGFSFVHVSNAAFQQPNLGLNMWGAQLGARYYPVGKSTEVVTREFIPATNRWLLQARAGIAFTDSWPGYGPRYPTYIGSVYGSKRYWGKNKILAGLDVHYHTSMYVFLKSIEEEKKNIPWASTQLALFAGHEFLYGPVGLLFQGGVYLHRTHDQPEFLYQKLGCNFYLLQREKGPLKEVYLSTLLKTHFFVAELFEMGIGVGF